MWKPPRIWQGGTCWIIGGGPSIFQQFNVPSKLQNKLKNREVDLSSLSSYMSCLHNRHVIGINLAYKLGNWIDFLAFGDGSWFLEHRWELAKYSMFKVSFSPRQYDWGDNNVERIKSMVRNRSYKYGINTEPGYISWNSNTGAAAVSLAYQLGAKRIILVGFDMDVDEDGDTHWHGCHWEKVNRKDQDDPDTLRVAGAHKSFGKYIKAFDHIAEDAEKLGLEIFNINKHSKIKSIPYKPLETALKEDNRL